MHMPVIKSKVKDLRIYVGELCFTKKVTLFTCSWECHRLLSVLLLPTENSVKFRNTKAQTPKPNLLVAFALFCVHNETSSEILIQCFLV